MNATFEDILEWLPQAHRYSNYALCKCLFHDDHHPSMFIYHQWFECKSCGVRGSLETLAAKLGKRPKQPKQVQPHPNQGWTGPEWKYPIEDYCLNAHRFLKENMDYAFYYQQRGVDGLIDSQYLGYHNGYFIVPIRDEWGSIIGAVAKTGPFRSKFTPFPYFTPKGQPPMIWSPDWSKVQGTVYFPFGIFDVLTLHAMGLPVIGWSDGKMTKPDLLKDVLKSHEIYHVVLIPDKNEYRNKESATAWRIASTLSWRAKVRTIDYPTGCKDPNDIYCSYGKDKLMEMIQ